MNILLNIIFVSALILFIFNEIKVDGCLCKVHPNEAIYCTADWVSKVKIVKKKKYSLGRCFDCARVEYKVKHINKFRFIKKIPKRKLYTVKTLRMEGACGVPHLKVGKEYILAGTIKKKRDLYTNLCLGLRLDGKESEENLKLWKRYFKCKKHLRTGLNN